jgi:hypothetical protein
VTYHFRRGSRVDRQQIFPIRNSATDFELIRVKATDRRERRVEIEAVEFGKKRFLRATLMSGIVLERKRCAQGQESHSVDRCLSRQLSGYPLSHTVSIIMQRAKQKTDHLDSGDRRSMGSDVE